MTDAPQAAPAAEMTPEQASARRTELMGNPEWRKTAMSGEGWAEMQRLDSVIASGVPDEDDVIEEASGDNTLIPPNAEGWDPEGTEAPPGFFDPPATASGYELPNARARGVEVNTGADIALRQSLHAAGVDGALAQTLYGVAIEAALKPHDEVSLAGQKFKSEARLREKWGDDFEANLTLVNDYGRSLFEKMPESVTGGQTFQEFCITTGIANNAVVIEQMLLRARR